jgi:hypothetical protein
LRMSISFSSSDSAFIITSTDDVFCSKPLQRNELGY